MSWEDCRKVPGLPLALEVFSGLLSQFCDPVLGMTLCPGSLYTFHPIGSCEMCVRSYIWEGKVQGLCGICVTVEIKVTFLGIACKPSASLSCLFVLFCFPCTLSLNPPSSLIREILPASTALAILHSVETELPPAPPPTHTQNERSRRDGSMVKHEEPEFESPVPT